MRILIVTHRSLPAHPAGTEVHTHALARALGALGHEVRVFTAEKDVARADLSVHEREYDGVSYTELVNNLFHTSFEQTYRHAGSERRFAELLEAWRPDVVHASHLLYHSIGYARIARKCGAAFCMTLFDFWLMCPRFGQRRFVDGSLCATIDMERCARCMASFKYAATSTERRVGGALAAVKRATRLDLAPLAKRAAAVGSGAPGSSASVAAPPAADPVWLAELEARERAMLDELVPHVDAFVAPSRFLRDEFLRWGLPGERVHFVRTGIDLAPFAQPLGRAPGPGVRFGFIGTVVPHKGTHVFVEALERLDPLQQEGAGFHVWGPDDHAADYAADLRRRVDRHAERHGNATWWGRLVRSDLGAALERIDVLVVPSLWYENAPLVILEALAAGRPVVVSDLGGMAELARESGAGVVFPAGDVGALTRVLEQLVQEPARLDELRARTGGVRAVEDDARDFLALYAEALAR